MEHLDKLIPLAILGVVTAFVVVLLRRVLREETLVPVMPASAPVVDLPRTPLVEPPVTATAALKEQSKRSPGAPKAMPSATPLASVIDLLKQKDTLTMAFVMHEIFAPPVSKR